MEHGANAGAGCRHVQVRWGDTCCCYYHERLKTMAQQAPHITCTDDHRTRRWSYIESNSPTFSYAVDDRGAPLAMTVSGGIRSCQGWRSGNVCTSVGRRDGRTLAELMELARKRCVCCCTCYIVRAGGGGIKGSQKNEEQMCTKTTPCYLQHQQPTYPDCGRLELVDQG